MKLIKFSIILLFLLVSCRKDKPEPQLYTSVCGTVIDSDGFLQDVSVSFLFDSGTKGGPVLTKTDGYYCLNNLESGNATFTFVKEGYETVTQSVTVNINGEPDPVNITMKKKAALVLKASEDIVEFTNGEDQKSLFLENTLNEGNVSFSINVADDSKSWLLVDKSSGSISDGGIFQFTISVNRTGLGVGSKTGIILINSTDNNLQITVNLTITNPESPTVTVTQPANITQVSAEVIGTIINEGGSPVTERGHVWSADPSPTLESNLGSTKKGPGGLGTFSSVLSGLESGRTYYVRAYAQNNIGLNYSRTESFTTGTEPTAPSISINSVSEIDKSSATVRAIVNDDGGKNLTQIGIVWSKAPSPTTADDKLVFDPKTNEEFTAVIENLESNQDYYVSAFASNEVGTAYSTPIPFKTLINITPVSLLTGVIEDVTETSAYMRANIRDFRGNDVVEHGFCWSNVYQEPTLENAFVSKLGSKGQTGEYAQDIKDLKKSSFYYFRAYTTNNAGLTSYGNIQTFATGEEILDLYYPLNNDVKDYTRDNDVGSTTAEFVPDRFGNDLSALKLNNSFFRVGESRNPSTTSLSFWVNISDNVFSGEESILFSKSTNTPCSNKQWSSVSYFFSEESNSLSVRRINGFNNFSETFKLIDKDVLPTGWHHLVFLEDLDRRLQIFIDGFPYNEVETPSSFATGFGFWTFGDYSYRDESCEPKIGVDVVIDDIRIYSRALTESQIKEIYNRQKP